jgi:hypothetical protein
MASCRHRYCKKTQPYCHHISEHVHCIAQERDTVAENAARYFDNSYYRGDSK